MKKLTFERIKMGHGVWKFDGGQITRESLWLEGMPNKFTYRVEINWLIELNEKNRYAYEYSSLAVAKRKAAELLYA